MRVHLLTMIVLCATSVACSNAPSAGTETPQFTADAPNNKSLPKAWRTIYSDGISHYALIDKSKWRDKALYWEAALDICRGQEMCMVAFWKDPSEAPTAANPLNKQNAAFQTAMYAQNDAKGLREMIWSCAIAAEGTECFN